MSLNGFIVDVRTVSESNLELEVDASRIAWEEYRKLVDELGDVLSEVDEKWSARSWLVRGRSVRGRFRRVTAEDRRRMLRFSPLPSSYSNILKNTRTYMYGLVADNCLVLEQVGTRKVYLLPRPMAPLLVEGVDKINREVIEPLRKNITEFKDGDDYLKIEKLLFRHGIDPAVLRTATFNIGDFIVDVLPVNFGYSVNGDDVYTRMRRTETVKGLEILKAQLARKHREYALNAVSDITRRIVDLASGIELRRRTHGLEGKLDALKEICDSLGLGEISEKVIAPLRQIVQVRASERPDLTEKLFGTRNLKEAVENALKASAQVLEEKMETFYANAFTIGIADGNVLIVFELHIEGKESGEKAIVMSPTGFKTLIKSAEKQIEEFEKEQGKIKEWTDLNPEKAFGFIR